MPTMASFVGMTPWAPVTPWIILPSGARELVINPAPAPMSRKPRLALMAPPMICPAVFFIARSPMAVMMPIRYAGSLRISFTRNFEGVTSQPMMSLLFPSSDVVRVPEYRVDLRGAREVLNHLHRPSHIAQGPGDLPGGQQGHGLGRLALRGDGVGGLGGDGRRPPQRESTR